MKIYSLKPLFQKRLQPVARILAVNSVHPTILTLSGIVVSALLASAVRISSQILSWFVPLLVFLRLSLNALDGMVAKQRRMESTAGTALNELSDLISDVFIFAGLALAPNVNAFLGLAVLLLVQLTNIAGIAGHFVLKRHLWEGSVGKADRMVYLAFFAIIIAFTNETRWWNYLLVIIGLGSIITMIQRIQLLVWRRV